MSFNISSFHNVVIDRHTGDGFRNGALQGLDYKDSVVIANKQMTEFYYQDRFAVTIQRLNKIVNSDECKNIKTIYIDTLIPRIESKAFKSLKRLCKGRRIVFIQHPHDLSALVAAMQLISVTNKQLTIAKFNYYQFTHGSFRK